MRTTVRLDDALLDRAKREAERGGETLTALIECALRLVLANPEKLPKRPHVEIPVCREGGGALPGVDLDESAALLDFVEGRRWSSRTSTSSSTRPGTLYASRDDSVDRARYRAWLDCVANGDEAYGMSPQVLARSPASGPTP